jgi:hypothetical protein
MQEGLFRIEEIAIPKAGEPVGIAVCSKSPTISMRSLPEEVQRDFEG